MIGNNSCGVHSLMAGKTVDNVEELEILHLRRRCACGRADERRRARAHHRATAAGAARSTRGSKRIRDRYADLIRERFPKIPRRVSGYNLDELLPENGFNVARALVGTEGTCVDVLEAKLQLVHSPPERALVVLGYPRRLSRPPTTCREILRARPIGLEGIDDRLVDGHAAASTCTRDDVAAAAARATAGCWSSSAATPRTRPTPRPQR